MGNYVDKYNGGLEIQAPLGVVIPSGITVGNTSKIGATTLDWYEEGTFTPTVAGITTSGSGTYTVRVGKYTRIGNTVHIKIKLVWTAHTGTGEFRMTGLPFIASNDGMPAPVSWLSNSYTNTGGTIQCYIVPNTANVEALTFVSNATSPLLPLDTAAEVYICGTYQV